mmetsp:Transcript_3525/g.6592  ORF Transcript_3525/g.6592 Transcript_3525/m.6592 type:complete len:762 (+) Transcript_3525:52-2337(+)
MEEPPQNSNTLTQKDREFLVNSLGKTPLLAKLSKADLGVLAEELEKKTFMVDEVIFQEGDAGDGFYVIMSGSCIVTKKSAGEGKDAADIKLATLSGGDYFGEGALVNEAPRGATITCSKRMMVAFWNIATFKRLKKERLKGIRFVQRKAISAEMVQSLADEVDEKKLEKSDEQRRMIYNTIKKNDLFRNLSSEHMRDVIAKMHQLDVKKGTTVITQGENGYKVYVVEKGSFSVYIDNPGGRVRVATRSSGTLFGELALLFNAPRAATVVADTDSILWAIDRFTFRNILKNVSEAATRTNLEFLKKVKILQALTGAERKKIAEALEEKIFPAGSKVVVEGDQGDCMYIVKSGSLQTFKKGEEGSVSEYGPGGFFGEKALLDDKSKGLRAATVVAEKESVLLQLDRNAVFSLLGPIHEELKDRSSEYSQAEKKAKAATAKWKRVSWSLKELKAGKVLGKGSFGIVKIVTAPDGETYALKGVSKKQVVMDGQQPHIVSEKKVMQRLDHPFLVKLFGTYNDKSSIYFLLELCQGGELFTILRSKTRFNLTTAKFYAASVVSMFEYLHSFNIIYRDLKPENLLIDSKGWLKMTDFGFAKEINGATYTLCGTPDYLAPEILTGKGHGKGVDWWCLGILIYEMLASFPPFYDDNPQRTYAKIMYKKVAFPPNTFTIEGKDLIRKLLDKKAHMRLGVTKGEAKTIKLHPFFKGFSFDDLLNKRMRCPIVPHVKHKGDVSAFEDYGRGADLVDEFIPPRGYDASWEREFE